MSFAPPLTTYPLAELIAFARANVPFYRQAYADLPADATLAQLPVIDQKRYWEAHTRDPREVLSEPLSHGIVLNSGGSTGEPKFAYYNNEEWDSSVALQARALEGTGLADGDRVANFFASGYLYFSFVLLLESLKATRANVLQVPIGYFTPLPDAARLLRTFGVDVIAGVPSHFMGLAEYLEKNGFDDVRLRRALYAGEPFTASQRAYFQQRFPGVEIRSLSYASVDGGIIGYPDAGCELGEHRVFDGATILEIFDADTGELIDEPGRPGRLVFTNLVRRLMPTLRYPTGDLGQWVEASGTADRKFLLLGRAEEGIRLARYSVPAAEVAALLEPWRERTRLRQFQLLATQENRRDKLTLRLVGEVAPAERDAIAAEIVGNLLAQKPPLRDLIESEAIHPVAVEWISLSDLEVNPRTGKVRTVIDRRAG